LVTNSLVNQGDAVAGGGSLAWLLGRLALALLTVVAARMDSWLASLRVGWLAGWPTAVFAGGMARAAWAKVGRADERAICLDDSSTGRRKEARAEAGDVGGSLRQTWAGRLERRR